MNIDLEISELNRKLVEILNTSQLPLSIKFLVLETVLFNCKMVMESQSVESEGEQ